MRSYLPSLSVFSFFSALSIFALGSLVPACFLVDDDATHHSSSPPPTTHPVTPDPSPASSCDETRPQIFGLDMAPSAQTSTEGDYEIKGTIRYSCSGVTVQAHVFSPDGYVRWPAPSPNDPAIPTALSLRFAGSLKGQTVEYDVSVLDAKGTESWPPLRQSATLE